MVEIAPSVKNPREGTHREFWKCLMNKTKKCNSVIFSNLKTKRAEGWWRCNSLLFHFLERECAFSLDFQPIGLSVLDGARSKVALRGEGYAWALIWWSSDNSKR